LVLHGGSGSGEENLKKAVAGGINKINVCRYYVDKDGIATTNQLLKLDSKLYWFDETGKMVSNRWVVDENNKWYYFDERGQAVTKGWYLIEGDYYYFLNSGVMAQDAIVPGGYRVGADGKWVQ